jgi:hypothetical protein
MTSAGQGNRPEPPRQHETGPRRQTPPPPGPDSRAGASRPPPVGQHGQPAQHPETGVPETGAPETAAPEARGLDVPEGQSPAVFGAEIRRAVCYENGLAIKALIALAIVAALIASRLLGA